MANIGRDVSEYVKCGEICKKFLANYSVGNRSRFQGPPDLEGSTFKTSGFSSGQGKYRTKREGGRGGSVSTFGVTTRQPLQPMGEIVKLGPGGTRTP